MQFSKWRPSAVLNLRKLQFLVTWPISACDPSFPFYISHWSANTAPIYSQETIFNMASVRQLECKKFRLFVKFSCSEWKFVSVYQIWSKSVNSRLWYGDKAIFKMAAAAILNLRKLQFWSRDPYRHLILHFCSKFRVDRPIWRRDIAQNVFNMASVRHLEFEKFRFFFCQISMFRMEICICSPNLIEIGQFLAEIGR